MNLILPLHAIGEKDRSRVGGKGFALSLMSKKGLRVPEALCITTDAYGEYVKSTGLGNKIIMELYRKPFEEMRWEEIWDTSLRIRNLFSRTSFPQELRNILVAAIASTFSGKIVSVRSSAPGEDASTTSFAGLHESYVNISGEKAIMDHIRLVWASLWSDRALLYRQELGLDVEKSVMAVVVQEMVQGNRSGVVFGKNPMDESQSVVEAVHGLNQGLVDGTVEPDRWILNRRKGMIVSHHPALRDKALRPVPGGIRLRSLSTELKKRPPLKEREVAEVYDLAMQAEFLFGPPQDVEWTYKRNSLYPLQARPITTQSISEDDERPWYISLHRSFDNLKELRTKIENELIPDMENEARQLAQRSFSDLSDTKLADEMAYRKGIYEKWAHVYKRDCIPFAHGMRLFGQVYNDVIHPKDPFEFMDLLVGAKMVSIERNRMLETMASWIRKDPHLEACVREKKIEDCDAGFRSAFNEFIAKFGGLTWGETQFGQDTHGLLQFLLEMACRPSITEGSQGKDMGTLQERYLSCFPQDQRPYAVEILDLARASYRFRDDDNTYLGKIEGQWFETLKEGRKRIGSRCKMDAGLLEAEQIISALRDETEAPTACDVPEAGLIQGEFTIKARQLVGQPAGDGIAYGTARVVRTASDLFQFKTGEVLICDAVDPNMTFVVPLAAGIVERRGGMLIHGAIIAREYGIPCVTGVADAAKLIQTGDSVTVDGHLGIVIIGEQRLRDAVAA